MSQVLLKSAENRAREDMCRVGRSLFERGYVHATAGNISVRLDEGFLITPTDACLGFLDPNDLAHLDANGVQLSGARASKTLALHRRIYQAASTLSPHTSCVIHSHSTHLVALTLAGVWSAADVLPIMFKRPLDLHQTTFAMGEAIAHLHALWFAGQLQRRQGVGNEMGSGVGHGELVLEETGRPVGAVPLPEHVQRMVELRQILNLAPVGPRLAVPEFPDRAEGVLIGEPVREDVRKCK